MIYFDSAATTLQKPQSVAFAMQTAVQRMSSPGRGAHPAAVNAANAAFRCREEVAALFRVAEPERVVFTMNATHGLNIAIKTLVPAGGSVVISGYEHNAVTRPLAALGAAVTVAEAPLFQKDAAIEAFRRAIAPETCAVICNHVSNVFGFEQPIEEIAVLCREKNVPLIIDASQSAGVMLLDMEKLGAAFIAMPGHKGLYGPQGTGVLLCGAGREVKPLLEGGTGSASLQQTMPDFLPDRLEAGTHNMPGIAGLLAGVRYVRMQGVEKIRKKERQLAFAAAEGLRRLPDVRVIAHPKLENQLGVVSFLPLKKDAEEVGEALAKRGIAVRSGFHCAPLAHRSAGTLETGTVRISFSNFNTQEEVRYFLTHLKKCL